MNQEDTSKWVDILRVGTWTDMSGREVGFSSNDLDTMIGEFEKNGRRVPLVLGHPKTNEPAYGWVSRLRRVNDMLQASFSQLADEVKELVAKGRFKNVSVSVFPNKALRHVGLLGAVQPAVSGLGEVALENGEQHHVFEFTAPQNSGYANESALLAKIEEQEKALREALQALEFERGESAKYALSFAELQEREKIKAREKRIEKMNEKGNIYPYEVEAVRCFAQALGEKEGTFQFAGREEHLSLEEAFFAFLEGRNHRLFEEFATPEKAGELERDRQGATYPANKV
jgi:hypothetical protein